MVMTSQRKKCPHCKKTVEVLWKQLYGMRTTIEIKGKAHYEAKCPECNGEWDVKK